MARRRADAKQVAFEAWSMSRLKDWERCPRAARHTHLDRLVSPLPKHPAMQRGIDIHALGEQYLLGQLDAVPQEYREFEAKLRALRKAKASPEHRIGFKADWSPCAFDADGVWLRMILDAVVVGSTTARVVDFKTGKVSNDYADQVELYALALFLLHPHLRSVRVELWFLDHGEERSRVVRSSEVPGLLSQWTLRSAPMLADRDFPTRPGWYCRWCQWSSAAGGPCPH